MILYRFLNAEYGLDSIEKRRLKVSDIMNLNDPFEFLGCDLSDKEFREGLKKVKKDIAKKNGIICFSKTWKNPLLWSHYADKHRGICLGFKVFSNTLAEIEYVASRLKCPTFPKTLSKDDIAPWEKFMKRLISIKFKHWQYEAEYRMWVVLEEKINGLYYETFA